MSTKTPSTYDNDFFGWTQEQSALVRGMPATDPRLDVENLAEEIESLGRAELNGLKWLLRQTVVLLLKLAMEPDNAAADTWFQDVLTCQSDAVLASSAGLKQHIAFEDIWTVACNHVVRSLERQNGSIPELPNDCPFSLDDLLVEKFDPKAAVEILTSALHPTKDWQA